jgi:NADP-dependent 3-hydroxy acid dehydrogenase YdfG
MTVFLAPHPNPQTPQERLLMPTIAIVGAGPGMGLAIARTFGQHGLNVALISRNRARLDSLADTLTAEGITAAAFPADVRDHTALTQALDNAATEFGTIDVLEYSPLDAGATALTTPSHSSAADLQDQIEFQLYGAIAATQAVLPAMRKAGSGTLLYTTRRHSRAAGLPDGHA